MKITFRIPASYFDAETGDQLRSIPSSSADYTEDALENYLTADLIDIGITGGRIHFVFTNSGEAEIIVNYWAPNSLRDADLASLKEFTLGQIDDGIGEGGFEVVVPDRKVVLYPNTSDCDLVLEKDNRISSPPPKVAIAARDGKMETLLGALAAGESVDAPLQGYSPLHLAILFGNISIARLLIERGANVTSVDLDGNSPLHLCALSRSLDDDQSAALASLMINRGANAASVSRDGHTAISYADDRGKPKLGKLLRSGMDSP